MNSTTIKFLVSIKNSSMGSNEEVTVTYDAFGLSLLKILYNSGLIQGYNVLSKTKVTIFLRKVFNKILTKNIKLISKPTYKMILDYKKLSSSRKNTNRIMFLSTDRGLLTSAECKKCRIGGVL